MRKILFLTLLAASGMAIAEDGWKGSGELGLALTRGNSETESLNAKLGLSFEDAQWKHDIGAVVLRQKGEIDGTDELQLTANRYELSGSSAWKFSERAYLIGSLRYENDDFAPFEYQTIASIGAGWYAIKNDTTQWLFEGGPGYRRYKEVATGQTDGEAVFRGRMAYNHAFNAQTSFENILLVEAGSDNTFAQNDSGVVVKMNAKLALKAGLQFRHNSDVAPGLKKTDSLFTTNLVYSF
jgi:putative salt-induced outer membrane protein